MKIAFVYDVVHPWEKGGAQKRIYELARRLADDHDVHLYGMHYWDGPEVMEREGITYHGVCKPMDVYAGHRRSIPQAIIFALQITRPLFKEEFDIVDCQEFPYFPCLTAKLHEMADRSNLVVTWYEVWDDYWYEYLGWKGFFGKAIERVVAKLPETIIPISNAIQADLESIGRENGLSVVPNGVDYNGLQAIEASEEEWDILYLGRLAEHKNVDWLLEAVSIASDRIGSEVSACIIGDGPERESLEMLADKLGIASHVDFKGFIEEDEDVISHMHSSTVFILPSTREGFPNTILEASACGVPSVIVDHQENGATAVVQDGTNGLITDPHPDAIADAVVQILTNPELQQRLSNGADEFGHAHDWDIIVDRLENVYSRRLSPN